MSVGVIVDHQGETTVSVRSRLGCMVEDLEGHTRHLKMEAILPVSVRLCAVALWMIMPNRFLLNQTLWV